MIIRKPYAFLIKYFKAIHIILFTLITFLIFKTRAIYFFYRNYLLTGTYLNVNNLSNKYVGIPVIIVSIILIAILLLIFFLMKNKKKPFLYYLFADIFYFILFISLLVFTNSFNYLQYNSYSNQSLVLLRDLAMIIYYVNFIFLVFSFIRGFGFNIKKFNFEKDIKDLDITDADREEIELNSSIDYNKVLNYARRKKRNFWYYIKENSYILTVFGVIIVLSLITYFSLNYLVFNKTYRENQVFVINDLDIKVTSSYHTNLTKNGSIINNKKDYIIVNFNALNNTDRGIKLNVKDTKIKIKDKYYYPINNTNFKDLGTIYKNQSILKGKTYDYILVFEIDKKDFNKKAILQFCYGKKYIDSEIVYYYRDIGLNIKDFSKKDLGIYDIKKEINIKDAFYRNEKFIVSNFDILEIEHYKYTKCENIDGNCIEYDSSVVPNNDKYLLKIEYASDKEINIFNYVNLEYKLNDKKYSIKNSNIKDVTPSNYSKNFVLLEVDKNIKDAESINLVFDIRGLTFKVKLREV